MSMHRGGRNRARQKMWPGQHASDIREFKRAQGWVDEEEEGPPSEVPVLTPKKQERLIEHITLPDWDKRMRSLFLFKGTHPYRIRALENVVHGMFLAECQSFLDGSRLFTPQDAGHLCGIHKLLQRDSFRSIFGRLRGCKQYTDSISPAFTEYVEWMHPLPCVYYPVSLYSPHRGNHAWWRLDAPYKIRLPRPEAPAVLGYPYIRTTPTDQHALLLQVHAMIPSRITHELRADLCQDLLVAVLGGEIKVEDIPGEIKAYASKAREIAPNRWRDISLDSFGSDKEKDVFLGWDRHADDFAPELCEALGVHEEESGIPVAHWNEEGVVHRRTKGVGGTERHKQYNQCVGKQQFKTQAEAYHARLLLPLLGKEEERSRMNIYQCTFCRHWHFGHSDKATESLTLASFVNKSTNPKYEPEPPPMKYVRHERPHWKTLRGMWGDWK